MNSSECTSYLLDLGQLIKQKALESKESKEASTGKPNHDFEVGRLMAFHEIVSLMQQQAEAFGIALDEIALGDLDPERDLL